MRVKVGTIGQIQDAVERSAQQDCMMGDREVQEMTTCGAY